jgi:hypothetical protein
VVKRLPRTAEEFLALRRTLAESSDTTLVDELDEEIRLLIEAAPDQGEIILRALAGSDDADDRDTAAVNLRFLFRARPAAARDMLVKLARDLEETVRDQARECAADILPDLILHSKNAEVQHHALAALDEITIPY